LMPCQGVSKWLWGVSVSLAFLKLYVYIYITDHYKYATHLRPKHFFSYLEICHLSLLFQEQVIHNLKQARGLDCGQQVTMMLRSD
jgi:hypothetical protein